MFCQIVNFIQPCLIQGKINLVYKKINNLLGAHKQKKVWVKYRTDCRLIFCRFRSSAALVAHYSLVRDTIWSKYYFKFRLGTIPWIGTRLASRPSRMLCILDHRMKSNWNSARLHYAMLALQIVNIIDSLSAITQDSYKSLNISGNFIWVNFMFVVSELDKCLWSNINNFVSACIKNELYWWELS